MHIVFFTNRYLPDVGGVQLSAHHTARALVRQGHDVTIYTESPSIDGFGAEVTDGVRIVRFRVRKIWPLTRVAYWAYFHTQSATIRNADVLHFHDYGTFLHWFLPLKPLLRKPLFSMTFHGFDGWPIKRAHKIGRSLSARFMDTTFGVGDYISRYYNQRIDRFFVGAPTHSANGMVLDHPGEGFLYVGRLEPDTAIQEIVQAMAEYVLDDGKAIHLTVVGDGSLHGKVQAMETEHFRIDILGKLDDPSPMLAASRRVICTGFLSLFDALAFGKTAIVPAFNDIKQRYFASIPDIDRVAFTARSKPEFTAFLKGLVPDDMPGREEIRKRAAADFLRAHTWDEIATMHVDAWKDALARRAR